MKRIFFFLLMFTIVHAGTFTLTSDEIGGQLTKKQEFDGFGCSGKNVSPALSWSDAPNGTKSFAITVYDPDAPTGSGWWHWIVFNIPANVTSLPSNASKMGILPKGSIEAVTSYGVSGFGGACPPVGDKAHRYIITVYALDVEKLDLGADAGREIVGYNLNAHAIQKSSIVSYYSR